MNTTQIYMIVILVIVLRGIGLISSWVGKARRKEREFSNLAWGTDSLGQGIRKMQQEYSETPKSVSAMTSLYLPKIKKDFPEFQYDEMKSRAENVLCSYLLAIDRNNPGELKEGNSELKQGLEMYISMLKGRGQREHYQKIKIHQTEISEYIKQDGRCIITFQSALQFFYYLTSEELTSEDFTSEDITSENLTSADSPSGNPSRGYPSRGHLISKHQEMLEGNKELYTQAKYNVDVIYIQDREKVENELDLSLGINCPNCGAPVSGLGSKICEYCGTPVVELNIYAWTFSSVKAVK